MNHALIHRSESRKDDNLVERAQKDGFKPSTLDEKTRSIEVVAATEDPALVWDPARYEDVVEVLLMSGCELPEDGQIPLTIEHMHGAQYTIGSLREMAVEGDTLAGRTFFSSAEDAEPYYIKVKEGHLKRFSITYPADGRESVYVAERETATIEGKTYEGPILITKRWKPKSLGLVLYAADERAKARSEITNRKKEKTMDERLRAFLERSGLSKDATEDEAWAYLEKLEEKKRSVTPAQEGAQAGIDEETVRAEAAGIERERVTEINAMCERHGCTDLAGGLIKDGVTIDAARQQVLDRLVDKDKGPSGRVVIIADSRDKFRAAANDSLMIRSGLVVEKASPGADDLVGYSLRELARHSLLVAGQPTGGQPMEMIGRALTTSDFPLILANVAQKSLFEGWETADETWPVWCAVGSVSDFKIHSSVRVSEASDLDEIPDKGKYKYGERSEAQEQYQIATYGKLEAITRHTIIDDDLGALTDTPRGHGEAAARKVGDVVYVVLTANANMGDGTALFHSNHANLNKGGAGPLGVEVLSAGISGMKTQKDIAGKRRLNIRPYFYIAPTTIEGSSEVFFKSEKFDDSDKSATRTNPYAGNYFTRVYESRLDDDSETAFYLAAAKGKTIKVFFLNGVQKPYMESKAGWTVDGMEYKVRIDCGAKAMDWRGLQMNNGVGL